MTAEVPSGGFRRAKSTGSASRPRGRDAELEAVGELLARVGAGAGGSVLVVGGPGSGKSSILREAAIRAARDSVRVGVGAAHPGDQAVELCTLLEALFDGEAPLLSPDVRPVLRATSEQRYWVLHDTRDLLEDLALHGPVLICLDDLQWSDPGTLAALRSLPPSLSDLPVGWILASRPPRQRPDVEQVMQSLAGGGARLLDLHPLDSASVALIAEDRLGAVPTDELLKLMHAARGDPFALSELLAGLIEEELLHVEDGRAVLHSTRLPSRLRDGMRQRLDRLSLPARQAVTVSASLGPTFTVSALARMLDVTPAELVEGLEESTAAELLREQPRHFAFWHDITRDAVRGSIAPAARRALDRQAADVLLAEGALPVEVAIQLAASAGPGDGPAVATLQMAARQISVTDPGTAADLCVRALRLVESENATRASLIGETAVWMYAAGRIEEAQRFVDESLRPGLRAEQEAEVCLSVAGLVGLPADLLAGYGRRALALPGLSAGLRHRHWVRLLWNLQVAGRYEEATSLLPEAQAGLDPSRGRSSRFTLQLVQAVLEHVDGRIDVALNTVERALADGPGNRDDVRVHVARMWRLALLFHLDQTELALKQAADAAVDAQRNRQAVALTIYEMLRARLTLSLGWPGEALAVLDAHLPLETVDHGGVLHAAAVAAMGRAALHVADDDALDRACGMAERMVESSTPSVQRLSRWLLAQRAMAAGNGDEAHRWLRRGGDEERLQVLRVIQASPSDELDLVRIGRAAGDDEMVQHAVRTAQRRAELNPTVVSLAAFAAHARGVALDDVEELRRAVRLLKESPRRLALAAALEDVGLADPERDVAVAALDRALILYHDAGAAWDVRRVRQLLRERGVNRRLTSHVRPQTGWPALTDAEREVAGLVAQGLTNRQAAERLFVSPHTVSTHLRHVFEKLGISSRVDLARLWGQHGT